MNLNLKTLFTSSLVIAALGASSAHAAPPTIFSDSEDEGSLITLPVYHTCKVKRGCSYTVTTTSGTATAGQDFTPSTQTGFAKKRREFKVEVAVPTADDTVCEASLETFNVHVEIRNKKGTFNYDQPSTIVDRDCNTDTTGIDTTTQPTGGAAKPAIPDPGAPPVTQPANPAGATVITSSDRLHQTCVTKPEYGQNPPVGGGSEYTLAKCYLAVKCPTTATKCSFQMRTQVKSENPNEFTRGRLLMTDYTGQQPGPNLGGADCGDFGACVAERYIGMTPGDWKLVECQAWHDPNTVRPGTQLQAPALSMQACTADIEVS
jgi:hypothetical protein